MSVAGAVWDGLSQAFFMFWETLWALVLGFALSGAVQAFVSRGQMRSVLGDHRAATLGRASFLGMVSSSCSYAAAALAKSLFARGADFTAAMVFMVASTNLVVELGVVLWLLLGWQFALAELVGGLIMIVLLGLLVPRMIPARWLDRARERFAAESESASVGTATIGGDHADPRDVETTRSALRQRIRTRRGWGDAAGYTVSDLRMLRKELVIGFVVAGFLAALVPDSFWASLFLAGDGFAASLENAVLGPLLAILSFVCSVGNVPLAAALWHGGIGFGGVVSFVFADLITLPLLVIYRRYYGTAVTLRLLAIFWAAMSASGLAVEYLFALVGITAPARPASIVHTGFALNYTLVLNVVALLGLVALYRLYRHRDSGAQYARDPICGMQVEVANAPASRRGSGGAMVYFCSDHCAERWGAEPPRAGARHQRGVRHDESD